MITLFPQNCPRSACLTTAGALALSRPTAERRCAQQPSGTRTRSASAADLSGCIRCARWPRETPHSCLLDPGSILIGVNVHGPRDADNGMRTQRRTEGDACPDLEAIGWRAVVVLSARRALASRTANAPSRCPRGAGDTPRG